MPFFVKTRAFLKFERPPVYSRTRWRGSSVRRCTGGLREARLDPCGRGRFAAAVDADRLALSAAAGEAMPQDLSPELQALWLAKAGQWDAAHDRCQDLPDPAGSWIHAYLHREEGDLGNAAYWYARAGKPTPARGTPLEQEWREIAAALSH